MDDSGSLSYQSVDCVFMDIDGSGFDIADGPGSCMTSGSGSEYALHGTDLSEEESHVTVVCGTGDSSRGSGEERTYSKMPYKKRKAGKGNGGCSRGNAV